MGTGPHLNAKLPGLEVENDKETKAEHCGDGAGKFHVLLCRCFSRFRAANILTQAYSGQIKGFLNFLLFFVIISEHQC